MNTREIPRSCWTETLNDIAQRGSRESVNVRIEGMDIGDQALANDMPLIGLSLEEKGSQSDAIILTLERSDGSEHFTHMIRYPEHIYIQENEHGMHSVDIEDGMHVKTLILFPTTH